MANTAPVVHSDPDVRGDTPVFVGTRVPFRNLIDYLERNHGLDAFPLALRAPSNAPSSATAGLADFRTAFIGFAMIGSLPFDSKCSGVGVALHIGTGGAQTAC